MSNPERKTNARLVNMIGQLKAQSRDTGVAVWRDVALRLSKSRKNWAQPNLSRVSRYAPEGATILVPGKLLGSGELTNGHTIAAYSVSNGAREKIEAAGGRVMTYGELMNENPTGTGVVILGLNNLRIRRRWTHFGSSGFRLCGSLAQSSTRAP